MVVEQSRYSSEYTTQTLSELQKFSKWFNKHQGGNWPTVIGGWAVWSYYPDGFGSRDVDLICSNSNWIEHMMIKIYFPGNGFQEYTIGDPILGQRCYGKPISEDKIIFDLLSAEYPREDSTDMGVTVDWNWVYDTEHPVSIENNAFINVPELEFLITLKIIGCISRNRELRLVNDPAYIRSKIWKDCYDIGNLTTHLIPDREKISAYFSKTNLGKDLMQEFLEICDGRKSAFDEGHSKIDSIEILLDLFKK